MPVRKHVLHIDPLSESLGLDCFGLLSAYKPHTLAWCLNHRLGMQLHRQSALRLLGEEKDSDMKLLADFRDQAPGSQGRLLANQLVDEQDRKMPFVGEWKAFDYLFLMQESATESPNFLLVLRSLPAIDYAHILDANLLREKLWPIP